jgi:hypothetical protein
VPSTEASWSEKDRGEREAYERILALHVEIAEEVEALTDWPGYTANDHSGV